MNHSHDALILLQASTPRDLASNSRRLILTRWIAGALELASTGFAVHILGMNLPEGRLYAVGLFILTYNLILFRLTSRELPLPDVVNDVQRARRLVMLQIGLDWLSMGAFIHFTGGIASPAMVFFFIHVVMVTILLPGQSPYMYVGVVGLWLTLIAALEGLGVLTHYSPIPGLPAALAGDPLYVSTRIAFMVVGLFATTYVASSMIARLRERERQIGALLQTADDVNATLDVQTTLQRLADNAALALSVPSASIRLLDSDGETLNMVAAHGLSRLYREKGPVALSQSPLDRAALSGRSVIIRDPEHDPRIQYPREMAVEGIKSLLVAPIIGQRRSLGVLRVYSTREDFFTQEDADFVVAIAQQGGIALENAIAHAALTEADQQRAQFVRIVTHELRAPVTGAQSLLNLLTHGYLGALSAEQQDIIDRLHKRLDLLLTLINDLLAFAAGKAVDAGNPLEPVPFCARLRETLEHAQPQAEQKAIDLSCTFPSTPMYVQATPDGLGRIFDNLVGNAVKYTPRGGRVVVSVWQENERAQVTVTDTGIGIPQEEIERLGQEFYRATNARNAEIMGTGLGLAIVKQLVERFGGILSIQSTVGEGSTFTVSLPLAAPPAPDGKAS